MDEYFRALTEMRADGSGFLMPRCSKAEFERRFRMPREVFERLYENVISKTHYLVSGNKVNAAGKKFLTSTVEFISPYPRVYHP